MGINEGLFFLQAAIIRVVCECCRQMGSGALTAWLSIQIVLANLLVLKMVNLFGLEVTVSDAYSIGALYCLNALRETHGRLQAQYAVLASFVLVMAVAGLFWVHLAFEAISGGGMALLYRQLLGEIWPIMLISNVIFVGIQVLDYVLFGVMQVRYREYGFAFRVGMSIGLTQIIDTALFTYWALGGYGVNFWHVFIWSYGLKW